MQLLETLERAVERQESVFRAQLMCEDIGRLQRLEELAEKIGSHEEILKEGLYIGARGKGRRSSREFDF